MATATNDQALKIAREEQFEVPAETRYPEILPEILIVDDEADIRAQLRGILEDENYRVRAAADSREALEQFQARLPDLVILDIWLKDGEQDGLMILEKIRQRGPQVPVVMISGHGTIETAVNAIKKGAYDFIEKPFQSDKLLVLVQRALESAALKRENRLLKTQSRETASELLGRSQAIQNVRQVIERVAPTGSRVLITGAPGVGKDVAARMIHKHSRRAAGPFVTLNCAVLHPDRIETELFGREGSDETGGTRPGVLEQAHSGTLFLDEVADMPLETQGKILRVLQDQNFTRMGGEDVHEVDLRILASSNKSLETLMSEGKFRQDLYYRLNVVPLYIPPLADRPEDIVPLARHFLDVCANQAGLPAHKISSEALAALEQYSWPGNVRQLRNVIEWLLIMTKEHEDGRAIPASSLPPEIFKHGADSLQNTSKGMQYFTRLPLREARHEFERAYLAMQIARFSGNVSKTAQFVGMERSALHRKLKSLDIDDLEETESKNTYVA